MSVFGDTDADASFIYKSQGEEEHEDVSGVGSDGGVGSVAASGQL